MAMYLANVPIVLTNNGKAKYIISEYAGKKDVASVAPVAPVKEPVKETFPKEIESIFGKELEMCKHGHMKGLCQYGCR